MFTINKLFRKIEELERRVEVLSHQYEIEVHSPSPSDAADVEQVLTKNGYLHIGFKWESSTSAKRIDYYRRIK